MLLIVVFQPGLPFARDFGIDVDRLVRDLGLSQDERSS